MASVKRIGETSCMVPPITGVPSTIVLVGGGTRREIPGGGAFKVRGRAGGGVGEGSPRGVGALRPLPGVRAGNILAYESEGASSGDSGSGRTGAVGGARRQAQTLE